MNISPQLLRDIKDARARINEPTFDPSTSREVTNNPYQEYKHLENPRFYEGADYEAYAADQNSKTESFNYALLILLFCSLMIIPFMRYLGNRTERTDRTEVGIKSTNGGGTYLSGELYK